MLNVLIYVCGALVIFGGLCLSYLGVSGGLKNQRVLALEILYGTSFFVLTGAFLYFYQNIRDQKPEVPRPKLTTQGAIATLRLDDVEDVVVNVTNAGEVDATDFWLYGFTTVKPKGFEGPLKRGDGIHTDCPDIPAHDTKTTVFRGSKRWTKEGIDAVNNGDLLLFHFSEGEYSDGKGNVYPVSFCFRYEPKLSPHMSICGKRYWPLQRGSEQSRPVLTVIGSTFTKLPDGRGFAEVVVKNTGSATAEQATVNTTIWGVPPAEDSATNRCPEPKQAPPETMPSVGLIGVGATRRSGGSVVLTKEQVAAISKRETRLYVYLVSNYEGVADRFFLEYYARYDPITGNFHECPTHNEGN